MMVLSVLQHWYWVSLKAAGSSKGKARDVIAVLWKPFHLNTSWSFGHVLREQLDKFTDKATFEATLQYC